MLVFTRLKARVRGWLQYLVAARPEKQQEEGQRKLSKQERNNYRQEQTNCQGDKLEEGQKASFFNAWRREVGGIFPRGYLMLVGAYVFALLLLLAVFAFRQGKLPFLALPGKVENQIESGLPLDGAGLALHETRVVELEGNKAGTETGIGRDAAEQTAPTETGAGNGAAAGFGASAGASATPAGTVTSPGALQSGEISPAGADLPTDKAPATGSAAPTASDAASPEKLPPGIAVTGETAEAPTQAVESQMQQSQTIGSSPQADTPPPQAAEPLPLWQVYRPFGAYASEKLPSGGKLHTLTRGVSLLATPGAPVAALWDGRVTKTGSSNNPYSQFVVLEHSGGYITFYGNLREAWVEEGARVYRGEHLGLMPHFPPIEQGAAAVSVIFPCPGEETGIRENSSGGSLNSGSSSNNSNSGSNSNNGSGSAANSSGSGVSSGASISDPAGSSVNAGASRVPLKTIHKGVPGEAVTSDWPFESGNPLLYLEVRQGNNYLDPLHFIGVRN